MPDYDLASDVYHGEDDADYENLSAELHIHKCNETCYKSTKARVDQECRFDL